MTDDERRRKLEARARAERVKSEGIRLLLRNDYTVADAARVIGIDYAFASGVAKRAGLVPVRNGKERSPGPRPPSRGRADANPAGTTDPPAVFRYIAANHPAAILKTTARMSLPPSVTRVFSAGTKDPLMAVLLDLPVGDLPGIADDAAFAVWYEAQLEPVAACVLELNPPDRRPGIHPGYKWGHAAKVLAVYLHNVVSYSRYFTCEEAERIEPPLYCPIDGIVLERLDKARVPLRVTWIREIDTRKKFDDLQGILQAAAAAAGVPRVWFDDVWGDRDS